MEANDFLIRLSISDDTHVASWESEAASCVFTNFSANFHQCFMWECRAKVSNFVEHYALLKRGKAYRMLLADTLD